jgi:type II secretory pathway pseudopilin PulG
MAERRLPLWELVAATAILAVLAAMVQPQASRAAGGDDRVVASDTQLKILRNAIERYCFDHGAWPGQRAAGPDQPAGSAAAVVAQLTQYSDAGGRTAAVPSAHFRFGPYLEAGMPDCPVSPGAGRVAISGHEIAAADWIYDCATGTVVPVHAAGVAAATR